MSLTTTLLTKQKSKTKSEQERTMIIMANKLTREQLGVKLGDQIVIKGEMTFSRVFNRIEGEEFQKDVERRRAAGRIPETGPYFTLSIKNPVITSGADTPLAKFHEQGFYSNKNTGELTLSLTSKSSMPVGAFQLQDDGTAIPIQLEGELAQGQEVYVLINTFKSKNYANLSSSFSALMFPVGPINYYKSGISQALAGFGVKQGVAPTTTAAAAPAQPAAPVQPVAETAAPVQTEQAGFVPPVQPQANVNPVPQAAPSNPFNPFVTN